MVFFNIKNLIRLTFFLDLLLIDKKLYTTTLKIHPFYLPNKKPILSIDKSKKKILKKGREYLDKCLFVPNKQTYKYIKQPKASVIIPLYNCEKTIKPTLHSIQYQNMSEIEIILINDCSTDNTSKIIEKAQKYDHRIKAIKNNKNMGALYSRSIAALLTKGEYIFGLDNDDMYFYDDVFDYIYKRGKLENLDIIGFLTINLWNYYASIKKMKNIYTYQYPDELYLEQPELSTWMIKFKGKFLVHNNMIWDKCMKSSLYKKAVNILGYKRFSKFLIWAEDASMNFVIFNLARNFKYVYKYGIMHYKGNSTATFRQSPEIRVFGEIFFLDVIYEFSRNNIEDKNLIVGQALYIYDRYNITTFIKSHNSYYLKSVLNKLIKCEYLSKLNIKRLKRQFSSFFY